jgi:long-chain acyl-CoA synthetase
MLNLAAILERNAALMPDKTAVVCSGTPTSYAQLDAAANQVANALIELGVVCGDKVVLACPNVLAFPTIYYGILKADAVVVPINVLLKSAEIAYVLRDCEARAFFCFEGGAELPLGREARVAFELVDGCLHLFMIGQTAEQTSTLDLLMAGQPATPCHALSAADDTAVILYTSGTTGQPKGAELTHANLAMNALATHALLRQQADDVHLVVLPLFHSFGQTAQMNAAMTAGATLVLLARFEPDAVLTAMRQYHVSIFAGVPTMYIGLLNLHGAAERHDLAAIAARLRIGLSGGAAMPVEVIRQCEQRFDIAILEGYGLTETSPVATFNFLDGERIAGSVGQPLWGTQVRIVDDDGIDVAPGGSGEVVVRGHNIMKGYYKRPEATAAAIRNGWFHTGDIGRFDERGNLFIVDRLKDMIIRGGFNVYPRELEEVLMTHAAVAQVAVIGVPHATHGEEVMAVIVCKPGSSAAPADLLAWCRERMAAYKYPRLVEIVAALPMTSTGKVLKRELRDGYTVTSSG